MRTVKTADLGLTAKPYPVADLRFSKIPGNVISHSKERIPRVNTVTIKKNGDFHELPF